ncbi:MAG: LemA family protein, partial [Aeromonadaceae bacterium]
MWLLLSLLLIILLPLIIVVRIYNQLVTLKAQFENGFAQIEVQLRRRHDLIPNLVETVKGYLRHEQSTLTAVIEARNAASALLKSTKAHPADGVSMTMLGQAENRLGQALAGLNIQMEAYPELKANDNIQQLFEELTATENRVAFARQAFNDGV